MVDSAVRETGTVAIDVIKTYAGRASRLMNFEMEARPKMIKA